MLGEDIVVEGYFSKDVSAINVHGHHRTYCKN
jgi:hypothetical protein